MDQIKIGKFIAICRKEKKLTQSELAEKLGVSDRTISKWETGRGMPDLSLFQSLCETLNISYNELLNGEKIDKINENYEQTIINTINYSSRSIENSNNKVRLLSLFILAFIIALLSFLWNDPMISYGGISLAFWLMAISCLLPFLSYGYKNYTYLISIVSFGLCLISILNIFHLTNQFVIKEDSSAIFDTFPMMFQLSKFCTICTLATNLGVYFLFHKRKKST